MSFLSSVASLIPSLGWLFGSQPTGPFVPTYKDVCRARALLKALKLPTEIVLQILDHAHYWPVSETKTQFHKPCIASAGPIFSSSAALCFEANIFDNASLKDILRSGERFKIKGVEFTIASGDQGWTSENTHGTFSTSSWLEVSILRNATVDIDSMHLMNLSRPWTSSPLDFHNGVVDRGLLLVKRPESAMQGPQDGEGDLAWYLQGNRVAAGNNEYRVRWNEEGCEGNEGAGTGEGFLQELQDGDRLLVWARAKVSRVV